MKGGLQGDFGDLDNKYLKKNISRCWSEISGSFRRTPRHCILRKNSPGKRYQRIRICLTGEVETSSSLIRLWDIQMWNIRSEDSDMFVRTEFLPGWNELCGKGDRLRVQGVGTPLPDDMECARLSGSTPSGFPKRTRGALLYPDSLKLKNTTLVNITLRMIAYPIWICCPDHWLMWASLATAHVPSPSDGVSGHLLLLAFRICLWQRTSKLCFFMYLSFPLLCHGFQRTLLNLLLLWWSKSY